MDALDFAAAIVEADPRGELFDVDDQLVHRFLLKVRGWAEQAFAVGTAPYTMTPFEACAILDAAGIEWAGERRRHDAQTNLTTMPLANARHSPPASATMLRQTLHGRSGLAAHPAAGSSPPFNE